MTETVFGISTGVMFLFIVGLMWRYSFKVDEKISRVYKRIDETRDTLLKKEIFEIEKAHLKEKHDTLSAQVTVIATDVKELLAEFNKIVILLGKNNKGNK